MNKEQEVIMKVIEQYAELSECSRCKVGAAIVKDGHIIALGYNSTSNLEQSCTDLGCSLYSNCLLTVHAEVNVIISCARFGVSTKGAELYCTHRPCNNCSRAIINAGISKVYYRKDYQQERTINLEDYIRVFKI